MKSRITIEVDFDNGNQPTIVLNLQKSDDVRDKLLESFINKFAHQRSWCQAHYMGESMNGKQFNIIPIEPKDFVEQGKLMTLLGYDYYPKKAATAKVSNENPNISRRNYMPELSIEEKGILKLMDDIEKLGAHPLLTEVINALSEARERLADWVELPKTIGIQD